MSSERRAIVVWLTKIPITVASSGAVGSDAPDSYIIESLPVWIPIGLRVVVSPVVRIWEVLILRRLTPLLAPESLPTTILR